MALALEGIKVVDVSQVAAVPMAARLLADFGADVIKVENPATGDFFRGYSPGVWENFNRNKRGMTLDLSLELGQAVLYRLVEEADVFLTNMRPFELKKFNLGYDTLSRLNPGLIYCALTGYGKKGPEKDSPAYDHTAYWARAGIPYRIPAPQMPLSVGPGAFGDNVAALGLAYGVMTALFMRQKTGEGQEVDLSLFHTSVYQLSFSMASALFAGPDYRELKYNSRDDFPNALTLPYQTKDGKWLLILVLHPDRYWAGFCRAIERKDLEHDPRFETLELKTENHADLMHILDEVFLSKTLAEWKPRLDEAGLPWAPFQNLAEVINDPQARANDFFVSYDHPAHGRIELVANPVKLSQSPETIRMAAPEFSQHTEEVLLEHGYTWEDIEKFKQQRIIA